MAAVNGAAADQAAANDGNGDGRVTDGRPPGWPGIDPRWTSSAKSAVGTAATAESRVWFTLSHGIVNEVYFPRIDRANTRDFGLLVAGPDGFFAEEKRDTTHTVLPIAQAVPAFLLTNTCNERRFRITKTVLTDPHRDVLLQHIRVEALRGTLADYRVFALLAPHIANAGAHNNGWAGDYKGMGMLFAERDGVVLALACSRPFRAMSCGYVGESDGWQEVARYGELRTRYQHADDGNIALTAELDLTGTDGEVVLALAFGSTPEEAAQAARAALQEPFAGIIDDYVEGWQVLHDGCRPLRAVPRDGIDLVRQSSVVLQTHTAKDPPGAMVASLSIPWGFAQGDHDLGGYHLAWPRDLAECALGFLASGHLDAARRALIYLMSVQEADGHWAQNMWLDGRPYWSGVQMDETALPILLADAVQRAGALDGVDPWSMVRAAAGFLARNGPVTPQDRWEEDGGYSPFTLAAEIAALLAAADFADAAGEPSAAGYLRDTADAWNGMIEHWTYVRGTDLAARVGVDGYYVRIAPPEDGDAIPLRDEVVPIKNRPPGATAFSSAEIISPDALALVRFGLRAPDDPRILNTVLAIDALLRTETATGPTWHRYNEDGYGEHADGRPFDGTGIGRGWPLLVGERAHYELASGNRTEAERLLRVMAAQAGTGGLLPEQTWDAPDIPERELFNGRPAGSAMPLAWAHAEFLRLVRSLDDGAVFDVPPQTVARYLAGDAVLRRSCWRFNNKCTCIAPGCQLRIEVLAPTTVVWTDDEWTTHAEVISTDSGLGVHYVDVPTVSLDRGRAIEFTFHWRDSDTWEGRNFRVQVE